MEYELYHHGILGMKWGIRRYQNEDGSLTPAGRKRLADKAAKVVNAQREYDRAGIFKRGKAREKLDKAKASYEKFSNRLEYGKMSDEKLLSASKDFIRNNNNVNIVATSQNVAAGQRSLEDKIKLYSLVIGAATSTVALINNARQAYTGYKAGKQEMALKEAKEQREQQKFLDDRADAARKYRDSRIDADRAWSVDKDRLNWVKYQDEKAKIVQQRDAFKTAYEKQKAAYSDLQRAHINGRKSYDEVVAKYNTLKASKLTSNSSNVSRGSTIAKALAKQMNLSQRNGTTTITLNSLGGTAGIQKMFDAYKRGDPEAYRRSLRPR